MKAVTMIVSAASRREVFRAIRQAGSKQIRWVYFGEKVSTAVACERWLEGRGERIEIGELLQEVAKDARQAFIDFIGDLSKQHGSDSWWLASLSEKNTYVSRVFLHACYVLVARRLIREREDKGALLFLVENRAVRQCLHEQLGATTESGWLSRDRFGERLRLIIWETVEFWARFVHFIGRQFGRLLIARIFLTGPEIYRKHGTPLTLLHSWVDSRSFEESGAYCSINFGDLERYLVSQGQTVAIVPSILPVLPFHAAVRALVRSGVPFLLPQKFLHVTDVLRAAFRAMARPRPIRWPAFEGVDISTLIEEDRRQDWLKGRKRSNALYMAAVRRWREAGIPIKSFIYTFENHIWEKAYCLAFRRSYPGVHLIGYQDANLPKMALNFFAAKQEQTLAPLPDLVITNGRYGYDLLGKSGHDIARLRCGGALRYGYLMESMKERANSGDSSQVRSAVGLPVVLVTTSMGESLACELLWKTLQAFKAQTSVKVVIKCHPCLPFPAVAAALGLTRLPDHFEVSNRPVKELLRRCNVLLYMDSTTSLESLAMGIPPVHVASDFTLDLDPLEVAPQTHRTVRTEEELRRAAVDPFVSSRPTIGGEEAISYFFGPIDAAFYSLFLDSEPRTGPERGRTDSMSEKVPSWIGTRSALQKSTLQ